MEQSCEKYENPLISRYSDAEMSRIWSAQKKHSTWRKLWLALAKCEKTLGLKITDAQLKEMAAHLEDIDFNAAEAKEKELRHDVMSHIHIFGEQCPKAKPIIHLGATSCFVTDNTELIQIRESFQYVRGQILGVIAKFADAAEKYKAMPALAFTHYQPAQLTTFGKRFCLYLQDFLIDLNNLEFQLENLPFRSVKGTTGTQASFLELFDGNHEKVRKLEKMVATEMGFEKIIPVSGQTYTRKIDFYAVAVLSGIAQSAYKFAGDVRLLSNLKELDEPFESAQVGSSAMPYKRNPMRSERICSLARYVMSLTDNAAQTHSTQWFERTLDDSANRRIVLPEAFLGVNAILKLVANVAGGMKLWPKVAGSHIMAELPFMASENIMMAAVKAGGDRQELHEAIRKHSLEAGRMVKEYGKPNDLLERIKKDVLFVKIAKTLDKMMSPENYVGRAPEQVEEFLKIEVKPVLKKYDAILKTSSKRNEGLKV